MPSGTLNEYIFITGSSHLDHIFVISLGCNRYYLNLMFNLCLKDYFLDSRLRSCQTSRFNIHSVNTSNNNIVIVVE